MDDILKKWSVVTSVVTSVVWLRLRKIVQTNCRLPVGKVPSDTEDSQTVKNQNQVVLYFLSHSDYNRFN